MSESTINIGDIVRYWFPINESNEYLYGVILKAETDIQYCVQWFDQNNSIDWLTSYTLVKVDDV